MLQSSPFIDNSYQGIDLVDNLLFVSDLLNSNTDKVINLRECPMFNCSYSYSISSKVCYIPVYG